MKPLLDEEFQVIFRRFLVARRRSLLAELAEIEKILGLRAEHNEMKKQTVDKSK